MSHRKTIKCSCGLPFTQNQFTNLPAPPAGSLQPDGAGGWLELRNCLCGSTIARERAPRMSEPLFSVSPGLYSA